MVDSTSVPGLPIVAAVPLGTPSPISVAVLTGTPYGTAIPLLFGRCQIDGIPLWSGPIIGDPNNVTVSATVSFAVAFGRPSINSTGAILKKLQINGIVVYDPSNASGFIQKPGLSFVFYDGSETQLPDPTIVADKGVGQVPGFRGLIYIVFKNYKMDWSGGTYPNVSADIAQHATDLTIIDQYTPNLTTPAFDIALIDWKTSFIYYFAADGGVHVYDTLKNSLRIVFDGSNYRHDFYASQSYNYGPYLYLSQRTLDDDDFVYMIDKRSFVVADSLLLPFMAQCAPGKGIVGIDELVVFGTSLHGHFIVKSRIGTKFHDYFPETELNPTHYYQVTCWADIPGVNVNDVPLTGKNGNTAGSIAVPADTTQFSIFYMGVNGLGIKRFIATTAGGLTASSVYEASNLNTVAPSGKVSVLNRMEAVFATLSTFDLSGNPTGGTSGAYNRQQYSLYEAQGITDVATVASTYIFIVLFAGPATNPYLSAIVLDTSDSSTKLLIFSTPWNAVLPNPQALAFDDVIGAPTGTEYTVPTGLDTAYTLVSTVTIPAFSRGTIQQANGAMQRRSGSDEIAYEPFTGNLVILNVATGSYTIRDVSTIPAQLRDTTPVAGFSADVRDIYDPNRQLMYYYTSNVGSLHYPGTYSLSDSSDGDYDLEQYITELCLQGGLTSGDIEFVNLSGIVIVGGILNTTVKLVDLLGQVCELFRVDIVETAGKIKFIGRYTNDLSFAAELTQTDLAPLKQSDDDEGYLVQTKRTATSDLPSIMNLDYLDFNNNCLIGSQSARRTKFPVPVTANVATLSLSVPIVMQSALAAFFLQRCLYDLWSGVATLSILLGQRNIALEPADYIQITLDDNPQPYICKLTNVVLNGDLSLSIDAVTVAQFVAFSPPPEAPSPLTPPPTNLVILTGFDALFVDNNRLLNQFHSLNTGATGLQASDYTIYFAWVVNNDASLYVVDTPIAQYVAGTSPLTIGPATASAGDTTSLTSRMLATIGFLLVAPTPIGNAAFQTDTINKLIVQFTAADPVVPFVDTDEAYFSGHNALLLGSDDLGWELIFYRNLGRTATGQLVFYNLARGRKGTDTLVDLHTAGEFVIFVTATAGVVVPVAALNVTHSYDTVPFNDTLGDTTTNVFTKFTPQGSAYRPWAPANLEITRDSGSSDLTLTWQRRARLVDPDTHDGFAAGDVTLHDGNPTVPLYETSEKYTLDILSDDGLTIVRSIDLTSPTYTYTAAAQTTDSNALTRTSLRARVSQWSINIHRTLTTTDYLGRTTSTSLLDPGIGKGYPRERICPITLT